MSELAVWTVSVMIRTDETQTRADAFLEGPAVEVECSSQTGPDPRSDDLILCRQDLAAARALQELSRRLSERATHGRSRPA